MLWIVHWHTHNNCVIMSYFLCKLLNVHDNTFVYETCCFQSGTGIVIFSLLKAGCWSTRYILYALKPHWAVEPSFYDILLKCYKGIYRPDLIYCFCILLVHRQRPWPSIKPTSQTYKRKAFIRAFIQVWLGACPSHKEDDLKIRIIFTSSYLHKKVKMKLIFLMQIRES